MVKEMAHNNNPKTNRLKSTDIDKIDYERMIDIYREKFSDASNFVFTFVGNVDSIEFSKLIEQYLATLPAKNVKSVPDEKQITPFQKGQITKHFKQKLEKPRSNIALIYTGTMPYNLKNMVITQSLNTILEMNFYSRLIEYATKINNPNVYVDLYDFPKGRTSIQIYIETSPEIASTVTDIVKAELIKIAEVGPSVEQIAKNQDEIFKKRKEILQNNDYWLYILSTYYAYKFDAHTDYDKVLKSISKEDIKSFTQELLGQGNLIEVIMNPE